MLKLRGAFLGANEPRQISDKFKVQDFYLDCSRYNDMTGERFENYVKFQIVNDKISLEVIDLGHLVNVEFYLNGRIFDRREGGKGLVQNANAATIEKFVNTGGEFIKISEEQMGNVEIPQ